MEVKQKIIHKEFQKLKKSFLAKREKIKIDFLKQNKAINCCKANSKLIDELIVEIYKSKIKYQIEPNVISYNTALNAFKEDSEEFRKIWKEMKRKQIEPNVIS